MSLFYPGKINKHPFLLLSQKQVWLYLHVIHYLGTGTFFKIERNSIDQDLNQQPLDRESCGLPLCPNRGQLEQVKQSTIDENLIKTILIFAKDCLF